MQFPEESSDSMGSGTEMILRKDDGEGWKGWRVPSQERPAGRPSVKVFEEQHSVGNVAREKSPKGCSTTATVEGKDPSGPPKIAGCDTSFPYL
ncbi:hypothetical protein KM043_006917 [Ampulex compressa]|nr:hypothetical protein KM043_006917 [Ampulex compressa]